MNVLPCTLHNLYSLHQGSRFVGVSVLCEAVYTQQWVPFVVWTTPVKCTQIRKQGLLPLPFTASAVHSCKTSTRFPPSQSMWVHSHQRAGTMSSTEQKIRTLVSRVHFAEQWFSSAFYTHFQLCPDTMSMYWHWATEHIAVLRFVILP